MKQAVCWIFGLLLASAAAGRAETGGGNAAVAVVVNKNNPVSNVGLSELRRLILGEVRHWANRRRVTIVQRDASSPAYRTSLELVVRMTPGEHRRFLLNLEFRGGEPVVVKTLNSATSVCEFVYNVPGAVAVLEAAPAQTPPCQEMVKVLSVNNTMPGDSNYVLR